MIKTKIVLSVALVVLLVACASHKEAVPEMQDANPVQEISTREVYAAVQGDQLEELNTTELDDFDNQLADMDAVNVS